MFWIDNFFDYGKCTDPYDDLIAHTVAYRSNDVTDWTAIGHTQNDNFGTKNIWLKIDYLFTTLVYNICIMILNG